MLPKLPSIPFQTSMHQNSSWSSLRVVPCQDGCLSCCSPFLQWAFHCRHVGWFVAWLIQMLLGWLVMNGWPDPWFYSSLLPYWMEWQTHGGLPSVGPVGALPDSEGHWHFSIAALTWQLPGGTQMKTPAATSFHWVYMPPESSHRIHPCPMSCMAGAVLLPMASRARSWDMAGDTTAVAGVVCPCSPGLHGSLLLRCSFEFDPSWNQSCVWL